MFEVILIISGLFVGGLLLKGLLPRMCAICFAVSLTWLYGLSASWDPVILAMLMGGSAVGLMYYLGTKFPSTLSFFKFPYLVTAFFLIYFVLKRSVEMESALILVIIWAVFLVIYFARNGEAKGWFEKVVQCCKNW